MKKYYKTIIGAALLTSQAQAATIILDPIEGEFTSGALTGITLTAFIEIEDNGLFSGTADTSPLTTGDGDFIDFGVEIDDTFLIFFDLFDDLDPLASFEDGALVGLDYFGTNLDGEQLNIFYDAFAEDENSGISVSFDDGFGNISLGTLDLPVNAGVIPEPSTYALFAGLATLGFVAYRRKRTA